MAWRLIVAFIAVGPVFGEELSDSHKRLLEEDRRASQRKISAGGNKAMDRSSPVERPRDARACENARIYYQTACGAPYSARSRSVRCMEAEVFYQRSC